MAVAMNDLPVEILIAVFAATLDNVFPAISRQRTGLALVSKLWASVCYNNPRFWAVIHYNDSPGAVSLALQNSREQPIDIFLSAPLALFQYERVVLLKLALPHLSRWRKVMLRIGQTDLADIEKALEAPAPLLEEIELFVFRRRSHCSADLFQGQASNLKTLRLTQFVVPWDSDLLSGLKILELHRIPPKESPSLSEVLQVLSRCPELTTFVLQCSHTYGDLIKTTPIHLPNLKSLDLRLHEPSHLFYLLRHLQTPRFQHFTARTGLAFDRQQYSHITHLISFLPSATAGDLWLTLSSGTIECALHAGSTTIWRLMFDYTSVAETLPVLLAELPMPVQTAETNLTLDFCTAGDVEAYLQAADIFRVTSLTIDDDKGIQSSALTWLSECSSQGRWGFPHLEELVVKHAALDELERLVRRRYGHGDGEEKSGMPSDPGETLAKLTELRLVDDKDLKETDRLAVRELLKLAA